MGVRDWARIEHRYLTHPEKSYEVLLVYNRITRKSQGIIVLRREEPRCLLVDIIAPLKNIPELLIQARRRAGQWESAQLYAWVSEPYAQRFFQTDATIQSMGVSIPTSAWTPGPDSQSLRDRWWLMAGDTDFL